jgi:hypothetical protein
MDHTMVHYLQTRYKHFRYFIRFVYRNNEHNANDFQIYRVTLKVVQIF